MLDFRGGGWVLALAGLLVVGVVVSQAPLFWSSAPRAVGDGRHVESYGFDLSGLRVDRDLLTPAGGFLPKDGLPALRDPPTIAASELREGALLGNVRRLNPSDRVIGVRIGGEARAYPLWVLNWHEIVNDRVGGEPIAVTYSPLCDSVVVFDRRLGGETLDFGHSGLLFNSNLALFDRRAADGSRAESLWSQLQLRAIAGPAAREGLTLRPLAASLTKWSEWAAANPGTRVLLPDPARKRLYRRDAYSTYFGRDILYFPVRPLPQSGVPGLKTPIRAELRDGAWRVTLAGEADLAPGGESDNVGRVGAPTVYAFWFAWHAMWPETELRDGAAPAPEPG